MSQKAIQTNYDGYLFRSRLEARWAVFFDQLELKWEYETEGFKLSDGRYYLPDFKVHTCNGIVWYEVKPLGSQGDGKLEVFSADFDKDWNRMLEGEIKEIIDYQEFTLLSGDPIEMLTKGFGPCPRCGSMIDNSVKPFGNDEVFFECFGCDQHTPCGGGHEPEQGLIVEVRPHKGVLRVEDEYYSIYQMLVQSAAKAARSARFEHGQSGARML